MQSSRDELRKDRGSPYSPPRVNYRRPERECPAAEASHKTPVVLSGPQKLEHWPSSAQARPLPVIALEPAERLFGVRTSF